MKFKIVHEKFPTGSYYYTVYQQYWLFFWNYHIVLFNTLEEAEEYVIRELKEEKERRKKKHQCIINWMEIELHIRRVMGLKEVLWENHHSNSKRRRMKND